MSSCGKSTSRSSRLCTILDGIFNLDIAISTFDSSTIKSLVTISCPRTVSWSVGCGTNHCRCSTENDGTKDDDQERSLSPKDFMLIVNEDGNGAHTNPLYVETATKLGLMHDRTIPSLVSYLLPETAPAASRHFVRRWLLTPPPPTVADSMSCLVTSLKDRGPALPPLSIPPVGKVLAMLRAGQASAQVFGELLGAMNATIQVLKHMDDELTDPLMILLECESGMAADPDSFESRCAAAMETIEDVISPIHHAGAVHHAVEDQTVD